MLKRGLLPVWRDRDTLQIGIDSRRAVALTGMAGAAWVIGLLDGSRDRAQVVQTAADRGIPAETTERVLALLATAGASTTSPLARCGYSPHRCEPGWPRNWPPRPWRTGTATAVRAPSPAGSQRRSGSTAPGRSETVSPACSRVRASARSRTRTHQNIPKNHNQHQMGLERYAPGSLRQVSAGRARRRPARHSPTLRSSSAVISWSCGPA